jgi:hypothetical protein
VSVTVLWPLPNLFSAMQWNTAESWRRVLRSISFDVMPDEVISSFTCGQMCKFFQFSRQFFKQWLGKRFVTAEQFWPTHLQKLKLWSLAQIYWVGTSFLKQNFEPTEKFY